ncbi:MAG: NUDIX hydrolase [Xanthomonadaceae bacterium]|jgi:8-oxo-dGTP pyrophosphatase MutT (NUDIX family)|nr:NUDIX hydrolase [Xanthomonadaceae bacterium]
MPTKHDGYDLERLLRDYRARWPEEAEQAAEFEELRGDGADPYVRARRVGHFTGSAWVVDAAGRRVVLMHHRKLGRWLQPGGHADGDPDLARVALREAGEETGLHGLTVEAATIFDLDRHWIPERGEVPGHWHYDVRHVVRAGADATLRMNEESLDLAWRGIDALVEAADIDASVRRMARKWLQR